MAAILEFIENYFLQVALCAVILLVLLYVRYVRLFGKLEHAYEQQLKLETEKRDLTDRLLLLDQDSEQFKIRFNELNAAFSAADRELKLKAQQLTELQSEIRNLRQDNGELLQENTRLNTRIDDINVERQQEQELLKQQYRHLHDELKVLGEKLVLERGQQLNELSVKQFGNAVAPLKNELEIFRKMLNDSHRNNSEQYGSLTNELTKLQNTQNLLSSQADKLTKALLSGNKSQGMWGEQQLERVLEASGLTAGVEYEREVAGQRIFNETGRPDALIKLPENRCLIIDAKCSLTDYVNVINATQEDERNRALNAHVSSVKRHITELARRSYHNYQSFNSPSFVFMFVPIDAALSLALKSDPTLYDKAAHDGIYLLSPSTLIPALRIVSQLWMLSGQNERVRELSKYAASVYAKYQTICTTFENLQKRSHLLQDAISDLDLSLIKGRGNLGSMLQKFSLEAPRALKSADGQTIEESEEQRLLTEQMKDHAD